MFLRILSLVRMVFLILGMKVRLVRRIRFCIGGMIFLGCDESFCGVGLWIFVLINWILIG